MIPTFDYRRHLPDIEAEVLTAVRRVLHSNQLILGPETEQFETEFAELVGSEFAIGVNSGTAALQLALQSLDVGLGDEVITVSNTCVPTIAAIQLAGATPVFVDVRPDDLQLNPDQLASAITPRTRCILPVHLYGTCTNMDAIHDIAAAHQLHVVEDCAQAHGGYWNDHHLGTLGAAGCFSFYPTKNIGAFGDAGAIVTNDPDFAARIKSKRTYGLDARGQACVAGGNARINEIQAAILRIKLARFSEWFDQRAEIARIYNNRIDNPHIQTPASEPSCTPAYHQYVIRCDFRDELQMYLEQNGIGSSIHYACPVHLMPAYKFLGGDSLDLPVTVQQADRILSLPCHDSLTTAEADKIVTAINKFSPRVKVQTQ